jgi:uncharacterized protein YcbX
MRYPVKSMRGEKLSEVYVNYSGLTGDRVFAFVNPEKKDNFPWHSARQQHDLLLYQAKFKNSLSTDKQYPDENEFSVNVTTPEDKAYIITDDVFLKDLQKKAGATFSLRFSEKGMQDARPVSLISYASIDALANAVGESLDPLRFRANFYIKWDDALEGDHALFEDTLVDRQIRIGEKLEIRIVKKDPRCKIINLDPKTGELNPKVLMSVAKNFRGCIGVYAAVIREGEVRDGDNIELI